MEVSQPPLRDVIQIIPCASCKGIVEPTMVLYLRVFDDLIERQEGVCQNCKKQAVVTLKSTNCPYLVTISREDARKEQN